MPALWTSFLVVALAEMGDKTQLVALALATRYRRAWMVMLGILLATTANHALAATVGVWVSRLLPSGALTWALAISFLAFGVWTLNPDRVPEAAAAGRWGALATTTVVFFLAEMGDKTQLATVALGARFETAAPVTIGTTLGMLAADGLVVFGGTHLTRVIPAALLRNLAAGLFILLGLVALAGALTAR
ncbi:MAG TPA: TMEM165/GDT1 family protein [Methylomirabilota bacterium]|nr:TMEM165/GDT1 family protein [Methylomirabilota bacterium]